MNLRVTNEQLILFMTNADQIIQLWSRKNKRSKYLSMIQRVFDGLELTYKSVEKHMRALQEKHALVNNSSESKEFILQANGQYTYNKDAQAKLSRDMEEYNDQYREIALDVPFSLLSKEDLPAEMTNQLIKVLCPFVISTDLRDEILYGVPEVPEPINQNGKAKE